MSYDDENHCHDEDEQPACVICGVAVPEGERYCGPSCERADEEQLGDLIGV